MRGGGGVGDFLLQQLLLQFVWGGRGKVMVDVCDPRLIFDGIKVTLASNHYISKAQIFLVVSCLPPSTSLMLHHANEYKCYLYLVSVTPQTW